MLFCPVCSGHLRTVRHRDGIYHACSNCGGRVVTLPQIRRMAGDLFATQLLRLMNQGGAGQGPACPFCNRRMREVSVGRPVLQLDTCRSCLAVWLDGGEFQQVPTELPLSEQAAELMARERLATIDLERQNQRATEEAPSETWQWLPMLLGFPTELANSPIARFPWATVIAAVLMTAVSVGAWWIHPHALDRWGFIPAEWDRAGGLTVLTSFFLHINTVHLASNLYFLLLCGDNVEACLGRWKWCVLVLGAARLAIGCMPWWIHGRTFQSWVPAGAFRV